MLDCIATAIAAIRQQSGGTTLDLLDPTAMAVALDRDIVVTHASGHHVSIEYESELTRGMSVVDSLDVTGHVPNTEIFRQISIHTFKELVFRSAGCIVRMELRCRPSDLLLHPDSTVGGGHAQAAGGEEQHDDHGDERRDLGKLVRHGVRSEIEPEHEGSSYRHPGR